MTVTWRTHLNRSLLVVAIIVIDMGLFWLISYNIQPGQGLSLRIPLDDWIPFLPATVILYSAVYSASAYALFSVRSPALFRRVVVAYVSILVIHLLFFAAMPVAAWDFRPDVTGWDADTFITWGVRLTFFVDPPTNLFPSQHVSMAVIAMLVAWKARPSLGLAIAPLVLGICVSIATMKQHYVVDGIAGALLAWLVYRIVFRTALPADGPEPAGFSWRGPAAYYLFLLSIYGLFFLLYASGFRPWENQ